MEFSFPTIGDYFLAHGTIDEAVAKEYIKGGDIVYFALPSTFDLIPFSNHSLIFNGETIGTVSHADGDDKIKVEFLKDANKVDDIGINTFTAGFELEMKYNGTAGITPGSSDTVSLFGKDYTLTVPPEEITIGGSKEGEIDITNKKVHWKMEIKADSDISTAVDDGDLTKFVFTDPLKNVGTLDTSSLKIGKTDVVSAATAIRTGKYTYPTGDPAAPTDQVLSINLEDVMDADGNGKRMGPVYLFFDTEIADAQYYTSEIKINNTANVADGTSSKDFPASPTPVKMSWITKEGAEIKSEPTPGTAYDPTNRTIKWSIELNSQDISLHNVDVTDQIPNKLKLQTVTVKDGWNGTAYTAYLELTSPGTGGKYSYETDGQKLTVHLGDITNRRLIEVTTTVDDSGDNGKQQVTYRNSANITFTENTNGFKSNEKGVTIGIASLKKSAGNYNSADHNITWTVTMDTQKQDFGGNLRLLDLLVYGTEEITDFSQIANLAEITGAERLKGVSEDVLNALPQKYNQKIDQSSLTNTTGSNEFKVYTLENADGKGVADLLVVTGDSGNGLDYSTSHTFKYNTIVVNPNYYANNSTFNLENTVSLYSNDTKITENTAKKEKCTSNMLKKDMLTRDAAIALRSDSGAISSVNSGTEDVSKGFDYKDKSVVYRLHVNANGLKNATEDITADGTKAGSFQVEDELPEGWKFSTFKDGENFLIYEGTGSGNKVTAASRVTDYSDILDVTAPTQPSGSTKAKIEFTFKKLEKPYVILVKAEPTEEKADQYFNGNKKTTGTENTAKLGNDKITTATTVTSKIDIASEVLSKTVDTSKANSDGYLTWKIVYNPYDIQRENNYVSDMIPIGIDLRLDKDGKLLLTDGSGNDNIKVEKVELQPDGTCASPEKITVTDEMLSYKGETRVLTFIPPDMAKAYQITYITDVTQQSGDMKNKVQMSDTVLPGIQAQKDYQISNNAFNACFHRSAYIKITKKTNGGTLLSNTKFVLYNEDKTSILRTAETNTKGETYMLPLPDGVYYLKESEAPSGYISSEREYKITVSGGKAVIEGAADPTKPQEITIPANALSTVGNLSFQNSVSGTGGDLLKDFEYTFQLKDTSDVDVTEKYYYTVTDSSGVVTKSGSITNGDQVNVRNGEVLKILDIPKDYKYSITQKDYAGEGYITQLSGDRNKDVIVADGTKHVIFTNIRDIGNLVIHKIVLGSGGDKQKLFRFTVEFKASGTYSYTGLNGAANGTVKSGDQIELKDGQSISIAGLLKGVKYKVTEEDYSGEGYTTEKTGETGTIDENKTNAATFTNSRRIGTLTISKKVEGNQGETDRGFQFTVSLGTDKKKTYSYTGNGVPNGTLKSGDKITLTHQQSIVIEDIPDGTSYQVKEDDYSADGYVMTVTGADGTIADSRAGMASFINKKEVKEPPAGGSHHSSSPSAQTLSTPAASNAAAIPQYKAGSVPDPNGKKSPEKIVLTDQDGKVLGTYTRVQNADGTYSYVDENGVALSASNIAKTGDGMPVVPIIIVTGLAGAGIILLILYKKKKIGYYYD